MRKENLAHLFHHNTLLLPHDLLLHLLTHRDFLLAPEFEPSPMIHSLAIDLIHHLVRIITLTDMTDEHTP